MTAEGHVPDDPVERALVELSRVLTLTPWDVGPGHAAACLAAGLTVEQVVQAVFLSAVFNYLTRVADATGIEADYGGTLPAFSPDRDRPPAPRPDPELWPAAGPPAALPGAAAHLRAWQGWNAHLCAGTDDLPARERQVLRRAAAEATCDRVGAQEGPDPSGPREVALDGFSRALSTAPWQMTPDDLDGLRRCGLDDRALLRAVAVVAGQNADSRLRMGLAAVAAAPG